MEASGCPKIVVADLDVKSLNKKQTVHVKEVTYGVFASTVTVATSAK
jgi:hypothetical protein